MNIKVCKANFLVKYNPNKSIEVALSNAVKAAVQHNILYEKNLAQSERKEIRSYWFECLKIIGLKFENEVTLTEYELIISELKEKMNKQFGIYF